MCICVHVCACVYVHVCVCMYMYVCACVCICVCMCMYHVCMYNVCVCMESFPMLQCKWCPWYLYVAPISSMEHCYIHVAWEADFAG